MKLVCSLFWLILLAHSTYAHQLPLLSDTDAHLLDKSYIALKLLRSPDQSCTVTFSGPTQRHASVRSEKDVSVRISPAVREEAGLAGRVEWGDIVDVVGMREDTVWNTAMRECPGGVTEEAGDEGEIGADDEVVKIVDNGPPENRVDVGDGYTLQERDRFFDDIRRLTHDIPSKESGIGVGIGGVNTIALIDVCLNMEFRDGSSIYIAVISEPSKTLLSSKASDARRACRKTGPYACDFPSLIANDEFYGGLGGEFVISTRSETSGTIVLRHEMGHNFIEVGEEYDGGQVYSGCNSARNLWNLKWKHWLTDQKVREEKSVIRVQDYAWYDLAKGSYRIKFSSDGQYERWFMQISASGVEIDGAMEVYLDGGRLKWHSNGNVDRGFHRWFVDSGGLTKGIHELEFRLGIPANETAPIRQLCSVTLHEYGGEKDFRFDNNVISAYPVWSLYHTKSYRPTNEGCLMRNMSSVSFCDVCQEGLWTSLLSRISLIDSLTATCTISHNDNTAVTALSLKVLPLAQFRPEEERMDGEEYTVVWKHNGKRREEFDGKFDLEVGHEGRGRWVAEVGFATKEVRKDQRGVLKAKKEVLVGEC
ncbi:hypothetical protein HK104_003313 [Borealophlyctis nickersoniae]|nr:hypothetical protein HK104_003313 [Borealophlyctis nickersoniae]